ncbi:MAG: hypothetical protein ABIY52_19040 [Gemmatimonadaceae bacterium]
MIDEPLSDASTGLGDARQGPYFESPTPAAPHAPRLLLIAYNFPPDPAVGGLRWQQMARYFVDEGWAVDVVSRDFTDVSGLDRARLQRLTTGVRVFSVADREPLIVRIQHLIWPTVRRIIGQRTGPSASALTQDEVQHQKGARRIVRSYLAWVGFLRDKVWAEAAAERCCALTASAKYVAVVSSGPPHMAHEAARLVSRACGLPYIMDMRDPWSLVQWLHEATASPTWLRLARRFEQRTLSGATLVTMNTEPACNAMRGAYPEHAGKIEFVRNGCDDEPLPPSTHDAQFRIRFAGSVYMDRDPRPVFKAARLVIDGLKLTPEQFGIELVGQANRYAGTPTQQIAEDEGISDYVRIGGRRQRRQVMEFLAGASVLLSLPQDSDFAVPAKIYEYLRFPAWMLVLATPGSATEQLLRDTEADVLEPDDIEGIAAALRKHYEEFASGTRPLAIGRDGRFDRAVQAKKMVELVVQRCLSPAQPRTSSGARISAPKPSSSLQL